MAKIAIAGLFLEPDIQKAIKKFSWLFTAAQISTLPWIFAHITL